MNYKAIDPIWKAASRFTFDEAAKLIAGIEPSAFNSKNIKAGFIDDADIMAVERAMSILILAGIDGYLQVRRGPKSRRLCSEEDGIKESGNCGFWITRMDL